MQTAYDTQQEAYADLQEQATVYNRTMNILSNPQEYSNPNDKYFALGAAGVHQDIIAKIAEQTRQKQLYEETIKKAPYTQVALGVSKLGGSPGFQERTLNQSLTQRDQQGNTIATPEVLRNIESTGDIAQAAQTTADANLLQQQTGAANSMMAQLDFIEKTFPEDHPSRESSIVTVLGGGEQGALLAAVWNALGKDKERFLPVLTAVATASADSAVARDVQNKATGSTIPLTDPLKPTAPLLTPTQEGQADYEKELATFLASAKEAGWTPEQIAKGKSEIAKKHGQISDPTTTGGAWCINS